MIKWFKRKPEGDDQNQSLEAVEKTVQPQGRLARFKSSLSKTRQQLGGKMSALLLGKKEIAPETLKAIESLLICADVGIETTQVVLSSIQDKLTRKALMDGDAVYTAIKAQLTDILMPCVQPIDFSSAKKPYVVLMLGVNGAGKTTTIGKLAHQWTQAGKKVMLAAGDTFRAAAIEQLQAWGERNHIPVIAQQSGQDSASVIYDAMQAAIARDMDILIADTAGRLHTQQQLMEELKKVKRVLQKIDPSAPHETMLVLDASIGQNALRQAQEFYDAMGVTGITMTKLDGTARGGILFAIAHQLAIPCRYVGLGEGIEDLRAFDATQFVDAIFDHD